MRIIENDNDFLVCIKPPRVLSTDEPGGLPELIRKEFHDPQMDVRTVHRLDAVVSGLMVLGKNAKAASELSRQIREDEFSKTYYAVVHGYLPCKAGRMIDFLHRDKKERKSYIVDEKTKESQEAILDYVVIEEINGFSLVRIQLVTGRTHQIRAQFSGHGYPLVGDKKYSTLNDPCEIALWSREIGFRHPSNGSWMYYQLDPDPVYPWNLFSAIKATEENSESPDSAC